MNTSHLVSEQRSYFAHGETLDPGFRRHQLERLYAVVDRYADDLAGALRKDLGKGVFEAYSTEIGFSLRSIRAAARGVARWSRPKLVGQSLFVFPSVNRILRDPYGVTLVVGPFNYPFQLVIEPLVGAIAGGNTCIVKPSEQTPNTASLTAELLTEAFPPQYVAVVQGGKEVMVDLLENRFDYIFFTGSARVGRIVAEAAGRNLTPVTLELGGKAPAIVDHSANLSAAARKVVWGKFLNAGQNCGAPDYVLVEETVHDEFVDLLRQAIIQFYGEDPAASVDYGRIATPVHWDRLNGLLESMADRIVHGGESDRDARYIAPTIIDKVEWHDPVMDDEIFGPILPVVRYRRTEFRHDVIDAVRAGHRPLALYVFASDRSLIRQVLEQISFGGGCVNDTIMQFSHPGLPFGGVGNSGIGAYHGRHSFDTFTHAKSVLSHMPAQEMPLVYPPQGDGWKTRMVKRLLR